MEWMCVFFCFQTNWKIDAVFHPLRPSSQTDGSEWKMVYLNHNERTNERTNNFVQKEFYFNDVQSALTMCLCLHRPMRCHKQCGEFFVLFQLSRNDFRRWVNNCMMFILKSKLFDVKPKKKDWMFSLSHFPYGANVGKQEWKRCSTHKSTGDY